MRSFERPVCIVGNGDVSTDQLGLFSRIYPLVAADGGAQHLRHRQLIPECIIGDLDSLEDRSWWEQRTNVIHDPDQDSTDFDKCIEQIEAPAYLCLGFTGDRFDHSVNVLHFLQKYSDKRLFFFSGQDVIFLPSTDWKIELPIGTRISFYPLRETTVQESSGLKYPLTNLTLAQGIRTGTSNETTEDILTLKQHSADLLCILPWKYYDAILK